MTHLKFVTFIVFTTTLFNLNPAKAAESAIVLPQSIFRARMVTAFTEGIGDTYNSNGKLGGLSDSLNNSITANDYAALDPQLAPLIGALNNLEAGLGDSLLNTQLYSDTTMKVETYMPALEYGLTKKLSIGIRVPIVKRKVSSGFSVDTINNAKQISQKVGNKISPDVTAGLKKIEQMNFDQAFFENAIFTSKGYQAPGNFEKSEVGDIEVGGVYNFYNKPQMVRSVQMGVRLPTGTYEAIDNIFDTGSGTGAWGLGAIYLQNYLHSKRLNLGTMAKLVYNFSDTKARAVPLNSDDALPSLLPEDGQVQSVTRRQAVDFISELSATITPKDDAFSFWGAYQFSKSGRDHFSGAGQLYYEGLSQGTEFTKHAAEVGFKYSTIPAFKKKEISIPLEIQGIYNTTLRGTNTPLVNYVRMDMIVYF